MKREDLAGWTGRCSKCGKCRSVCPTFQEELNETMVARGRIHLVDRHVAGGLPLSKNFKKAASTCILCLRCSEHCPNSVEIEDIMTRGRALFRDSSQKSYLETFILKYIVARRRPLAAMARMTGIAAGSLDFLHLGRLYRSVFNIDKNRKLPEMAKKNLYQLFPETVTAAGNTRKVVFFPGCSATLSLVRIGKAAIKTLLRHGTDVLLPRLDCCGMPVYASGDFDLAQKLAKKNIDALKQAGTDTIVTVCGSCGHMIRDVYKKLLGDSCHNFRVVDIMEYLVEIGLKPGPEAVPGKVTYHDPCHLRRGMQVWEQPRLALKKVPGMDFVEMDNADVCCGCGGSFSIKYYDLSKKVRMNKLNMFLRTHTEILATGCPACIMHLEDGLLEQEVEARVMHPIEILALTNGREI